MDITATKEDGIYLGENYRIPFSCSVKTEYMVTNTAHVVHSDVLDEAVQQSSDFEFEITFYESSSYATEKTDDFVIGEMLVKFREFVGDAGGEACDGSKKSATSSSICVPTVSRDEDTTEDDLADEVTQDLDVSDLETPRKDPALKRRRLRQF